MSNYSSTLVNRFGNGWTRFWFTPTDPIVLALLRVLVGVVALWWYLGFYTDLQTWIGPGGLLSPEMMHQARTADIATGERFAFSILELVDTASALWFVYILGLVAILLMIAGVFSRISTIAAFIFVLSFIQRTPMLARPVDNVLALLMFYLCIGPTGAYFSIDACLRRWRAKKQGDGAGQAAMAVVPSSSATVATRLIQVHLALVYIAMAMAQLREPTWWQGSAVWWMMARSDSRLIDATWLARVLDNMGLEYLMNFLTHMVVLYEFAFALLIWNALARPILLVLGVFVWLGLALISGWVSFALLMLFATLAFVPPETLHRWSARCCGA